MPDYDKVIKGLECCTSSSLECEKDCPYYGEYCQPNAITDALELLKNMKTRKTFTVIDKLTGEYPDLEDIALHEEWAKGLVYCDMEGFAIEEDGSLLLMDECDNSRYCPPNRFEVIWDA